MGVQEQKPDRKFAASDLIPINPLWILLIYDYYIGIIFMCLYLVHYIVYCLSNILSTTLGILWSNYFSCKLKNTQTLLPCPDYDILTDSLNSF